MISTIKPNILNNYTSVEAAADYSGYSSQYLRRLLRQKKLVGIKLGQTWLIEMDSFENYLLQAKSSKDLRFGPK